MKKKLIELAEFMVNENCESYSVQKHGIKKIKSASSKCLNEYNYLDKGSSNLNGKLLSNEQYLNAKVFFALILSESL